MNIAIAVNRFPSLSETFILDQVTGLIDMGQNVSIAARMRGNDDEVHGVVREYGLIDNTLYCDVPFGDNRLAQLAELLPILVENGLRSPISYARLFTDNLFHPTEVGELVFMTRPFASSEFDVVHSHFGTISTKVANMKKNGFIDAPLVASFHGSGIREGQSKGGDIYDELFEQADLLLANSSYTLNALCEFGAPESLTKIHPVGVNLDRFPTPEKSEPKNVEKTVILSVGRLTYEKGHAIGIRSFAKVLQDNPDLNLEYRIVGDGPLRDDLETLVDDLGLKEDIQLVGSVNQELVRTEMQNAHLFFHPSVSEGFGKVLLEAQAMELPILASRVGGIPDAVDEGNSAYLINNLDVASFSTILEELLLDPDSWGAMGAKGREFVEEHFDNDKLNEDLLRTYCELVSEY